MSRPSSEYAPSARPLRTQRAVRGIEVGERLEVGFLERRRAGEERSLEATADVVIPEAPDGARERPARRVRQHRVERAAGPQVEQRARIPPIAREELVAAFSGQHDFHARDRELRHEKERNARRERERVVPMPCEPRQRVEEVVRRAGHLVMLRLERLRDDAREGQLARLRLRESDRERSQFGHAALAHGRHDQTGVESPAEEHAERDVAHERDVDGFDESPPELVRRLARGRDRRAARARTAGSDQ